MFDIDLMSRVPIYEQLYRKVVELILKQILSEGDKLPSVRCLATQLGVNPNTVAKAYSLLERDGIICSLAGRGSFINHPDTLLAQERVLTEVDNAVAHALSIGIAADTIRNHVERQICQAEQTQEVNQKGAMTNDAATGSCETV